MNAVADVEVCSALAAVIRLADRDELILPIGQCSKKIAVVVLLVKNIEGECIFQIGREE